MALRRKKSKVETAKQYLRGGGVVRDDSDDELGIEDHPWEWVYGSAERKEAITARTEDSVRTQDNEDSRAQRTHKSSKEHIIGARMGNFQCCVGDTVLLKAEGNEAWVGLIGDLFDDEDTGEKTANFMWFSTPREIRNKTRKRDDAVDNELYITPSWDDNPLTTINGRAVVLSPSEFAKRYPQGKVPRTSKDFGKIFVCRRGCNTRTATYTEEFVWEDVYRGEADMPALIELVTSQTKATRKRKARENRDHDEFIDAEEQDGIIPKTPTKRRKLTGHATPSRHGKLTPKKLVTPTSKRVVIKRPLDFTPLGTRILSPSVLSSPFQIARNQLHVSTVPAALPCREEEFAEVYTVLERAITDGTGSCIYIAGTPGTGKTATVREVVAQLNASVLADELDDFIFVEINGMKVVDPHQAYSLLWEALRGDRVSPAHALELLDREFTSPSPRRVPCVVLMDELDQLVTKNQSVMYNFFNWPGLQHSRLIVLAVANTMDLPERTLSNKISSRLGLHRITFRGYTHDQLMQIIQSRLENVPGNIVHPDAIQFASRKVAAVSGDARRALDICRRAVEIAESEALQAVDAGDGPEHSGAPRTPSKTGRGPQKYRENGADVGPGAPGADLEVKKKAFSAPKHGTVTIATIKRAIAEATSSPLQQYIRALPVASKLFLAALLARIRRTGVQETVLGDVIDEATRLAMTNEMQDVKENLLFDGTEREESIGRQPRALGLGSAASALLEAGLVGMEARRGERIGRIRLNIGDEEVKLALRDDECVNRIGFA